MNNDSSGKTSHLKFIDAPNLILNVNNETFAYRDIGPRSDPMPIILLNHWGAVLDDFDPRIVDCLSKKYRVIALDYRGMGASSGIAPLAVNEMAVDTIAFIKALGLNKVTLFGFSLGGFVAQDITLKSHKLVEKLILAGTGPAGGEGIKNIWNTSWPLIVKSFVTFRDPKFYLFFTATNNRNKYAKSFLERLRERKNNRDRRPTLKSFFRQLKAIKAWGLQTPQDINSIKIPVLIVNGANDIIVPISNSIDMAKRIPRSQLVIYENAGHGAIFQNYSNFNAIVQTFLEGNN